MVTMPPKLRDAPNTDFINAVRAAQSMTYQERVPQATKANLKEMLGMFSENRPLWNEFMDGLVNRIGAVVAHAQTWDGNPFAEFKRGLFEFGDTIEEVQTGLIRAHTYDADRETTERELFGTHPVPMQSAFHRINRAEKYIFTMNEDLLKRAFLEQSGLANFISNVMAAPTTSDKWDEFLQMCSLFAAYEEYSDGYYHVKLADPTTDTTGTAAKALLKRIRVLNSLIRYPSTLYNAAHMPSFAQPGDMIFITTPEIQASIDVDALAGAFNVSNVEVPNRVITIPRERLGLDNALGILTTRDFFVMADTKLKTTSQYNPAKDSMNYWWHHWQILSMSRFVPAILFNTVKDDAVITVNAKPSAVTIGAITDKDGNTVTTATVGKYHALDADVTTTPAGYGDDVGIDWSLTGNTSSKTKISNTGVLYVDPKEKGTGNPAALTVTASCTWLDPANTGAAAVTASKSVTLTLTPAEDDDEGE